MLKNFILITLRNIGRNRVYSALNIAGLSIGMAVFIMILLWVGHERSYDRFHEKSGRIFRIVTYGTKYFIDGYPAIPGPITGAAVEQLPEVVDAARLYEVPRSVFKFGEKAFYEEGGIFTDPSFFNIFSFELVREDRNTVLSDPLSIVISESMAKRFFGDDDPVGKVFETEGYSFTVSGVAREVPSNSTIRFNYIIPFAFLTEVAGSTPHWGAFNYSGFVELAAGADPDAAARAMTSIGKAAGCPQVAGGAWFTLEPLTDSHLSGRGSYFVYQDIGSERLVFVFTLIAFGVLALACINFINLSTARSARRAREVGLRKVVGAGRRDLVMQFLGESVSFSMLALVGAVLIVELLLPRFNELVGKNLAIDYKGPDMALLLGIGIVTGMLSGLYPAFFLSSFRPAEVLKGTALSGRRRTSARSVLVITQFALSTFLIFGSITIHRQMGYMRNKNLGFDRENVVFMPVKENLGARYDFVKESLLRDPSIVSVTAQNTLSAFRTYRTVDYDWEGKDPDFQLDMLISEVDYDYFETLGVPVRAGRTFSKEFPGDGTAFVLNETAVKMMGIQSPLGKNFRYYNVEGPIVGVVADANYKSLHIKIEPHVFIVLRNIAEETTYGVVLARIDGEHAAEAIAAMEKAWNGVNDISPFEYHFLDDVYEKLYARETRIGSIVDAFTAFALLISCLGLYGLAAFMAESRTKEIGIRKVLGSSIAGVLVLQAKGMAWCLLIADAIALPLSFLVMKRVLETFAYRVDIGWDIFVLSSFIGFSVALLTMSHQTVKAAAADPAKTLKYE